MIEGWGFEAMGRALQELNFGVVKGFIILHGLYLHRLISELTKKYMKMYV